MATQHVEHNGVKIAPELDYSKSLINSSKYRFIRRYQDQGGAEQTLYPNTSSMSVFDIPKGCHNLSKSKLRFDMTVPGSQGNAAIYARMDYPPIRSVKLKDATTGSILVEIQDVREYWLIVKDHCTRSEFQPGPSGWGANAAAARLAGIHNFHNKVGNRHLNFTSAGTIDDLTLAHPNDWLAIPNGTAVNITATGASTYGAEFKFQSAWVDDNKLLINDNSVTVTTTFDEKMTAHSQYGGKLNNLGALINNNHSVAQDSEQVVVCDDGDNTGGGNGLYMHCSLDLGKFYETLFSLDKTLPYPDMKLEIRWESTEKLFFEATDPNDSVNGADFYDQEVNMSELALYIAHEQNVHNSNHLTAVAASSGIKMVIPYVHVVRHALGTGTTAKATINMTSSLGMTCLRIYSAERLSDDTINLICNFSNYAATKTESFYNKLDGKNIEDEVVDEVRGLGYFYNEFLNDGSLCQKLGKFEYMTKCPSYVVDFSSCGKLVDAVKYNTNPDGLPLSNAPHIFERYITKTATDTTNFCVVVCQKEMMIGGDSIVVV